MTFDSGYTVYRNKDKSKFISSGDSALDELLKGGFHKDLVYLLYGNEKITTNILLTTSVISQKSFLEGGLGENIKVAFIDGSNRFNPYNISKFAVSQNLSPRKVLENILISRAFTWDQMVEILENRLVLLEDIKLLLISGITMLFQTYEKQMFEDLLSAISGIKKILNSSKPLIILTAPLHECSSFRPRGGKIISHFGNVLVLIEETDRLIKYSLIQHPYLPENHVLKWKPRKSKINPSASSKNMTLDCWMK